MSVNLEPVITGPGDYVVIAGTDEGDAGQRVVVTRCTFVIDGCQWRGDYEDGEFDYFRDDGWSALRRTIIRRADAPQPGAEPLTEAELATLESGGFVTAGSLECLESDIQAGIGVEYHGREQDCKDAKVALAKLVEVARRLIAEIRRLRQGASE